MTAEGFKVFIRTVEIAVRQHFADEERAYISSRLRQIGDEFGGRALSKVEHQMSQIKPVDIVRAFRDVVEEAQESHDWPEASEAIR